MHSAILIVPILVALQFLNCHGGGPNPRLSYFDIDLLQSVAEGKKGNVMISPASIKSSLSMLLEGARGTTAEEIKAALRVSPVQDDFREELSVFRKALKTNTSSVTLDNANALFLSNKFKLKKDFELIVTRMYEATIGKLNFTDAKVSADKINGWVREKTHGLIPTVIEQAQIPPAAEMLLANALYFKAPWKTGFDPKSTHKECFYVDGVCKNVAMMDIQASFNYIFVQELRAHALELPYKGDRYSMIVLMPLDQNGIESLIRDLPFFGLPQIAEAMFANDLILSLPKFSIDYNENMVDALKKMHVDSLFSRLANLTGIFETGETPYLNSMYHSVHMTVDEDGTEAAAATVSFIVPLINNKVELRVDKPFLFFIKDKVLDVILFEGKIEEPTAYVETPKVQPQPPARNQPIPIQPLSNKTQHVGVPSQPALNGDQHHHNQLYPNLPNLQNPRQPSNQKTPDHFTPSIHSNQPIGNNATRSFISPQIIFPLDRVSDKPSNNNPSLQQPVGNDQFYSNQANLNRNSPYLAPYPAESQVHQNIPNQPNISPERQYEQSYERQTTHHQPSPYETTQSPINSRFAQNEQKDKKEGGVFRKIIDFIYNEG